ncbi:hypothetical protein GCM10010406_48770 [Streptomyces thermolineatus]|uniref:Uncharacterized protein n=1 Tax=Streptomyces thermolineatus TaxID=44033 RepID=A0ABN3MQ83_9ACTN
MWTGIPEGRCATVAAVIGVGLPAAPAVAWEDICEGLLSRGLGTADDGVITAAPDSAGRGSA